MPIQNSSPRELLTTLLLELQRFQANFEAMVSLSASGGAQQDGQAQAGKKKKK